MLSAPHTQYERDGLVAFAQSNWFRRNPYFNNRHSGSSRDSRKGTVCSDEASVFCYGHECGRLGKQTVTRLEGYPQLALPVRTIKYLGIYRHKALLSAPASRDRPRVRRTDWVL
jgi:hypothetical protein